MFLDHVGDLSGPLADEQTSFWLRSGVAKQYTGVFGFDLILGLLHQVHQSINFFEGRFFFHADVLDFFAEDELLDQVLDVIGQFVSVGAKELDAVVRIGIVGGGGANAGVCAQRACGVGSGPMNKTSTPMERIPEEMVFSSM